VKWIKSHWEQTDKRAQTGQPKSAKITYVGGRRTLILTMISWLMDCIIPVTCLHVKVGPTEVDTYLCCHHASRCYVVHVYKSASYGTVINTSHVSMVCKSKMLLPTCQFLYVIQSVWFQDLIIKSSPLSCFLCVM
jgi:hypothetical protein